jgi:hypothetical protein
LDFRSSVAPGITPRIFARVREFLKMKHDE